MEDWYENIEEPIRELVKRLRDNGINTVCSCGHDMTIQADIIIDASLRTIHDIAYNWLIEEDIPVEYTITTHLSIVRGVISQCFAEIKIGGK